MLNKTYLLQAKTAHGTLTLEAEGCTVNYTRRSGATARLTGVKPGTLAVGDLIRIARDTGETDEITGGGLVRHVFCGTVSQRTRRTAGGAVHEDFAAEDNLAALGRLVYKQDRALQVSAEGRPVATPSSRVILNQNPAGAPWPLRNQILDVLRAAGPVFEAASDIGGLTLPMEELRDITCLQALDRLLRLLPASLVLGGLTADWPASGWPLGTLIRLRKTALLSTDDVIAAARDQGLIQSLTETTDTPIAGVLLEIEATGSHQGETVIARRYQTAGDTGNPANLLHATLQLAGSQYSSTRQSVTLRTEPIPANLNNPAWWIAKHPRLAGLAPSQVAITAAKRQTPGGKPSQNYPNLTADPIPDIKDAGKNALLETFTALATVTKRENGDSGEIVSKEESIPLEMELVTTDAEGGPEGKEYTWIAEQDLTHAEEPPAGLAQAIYEAHRTAGRTAEITFRFPHGFHGPDLMFMHHNGLPALAAPLDIATDTATLRFGATPLAAEDLAALLTGFRLHRPGWTHASRKSGKAADQAAGSVNANIIAPAKTTGSAPGQPMVATIGKDNAKAVIDPTALATPAKFQKITLLTPGEDGKATPATLTLLATDPIAADPVDIGGLPDGTEIYGPVEYIPPTYDAPARLTQKKLKWVAKTAQFVESATLTVTDLAPHAAEHQGAPQ